MSHSVDVSEVLVGQVDCRYGRTYFYFDLAAAIRYASTDSPVAHASDRWARYHAAGLGSGWAQSYDVCMSPGLHDRGGPGGFEK